MKSLFAPGDRAEVFYLAPVNFRPCELALIVRVSRTLNQETVAEHGPQAAELFLYWCRFDDGLEMEIPGVFLTQASW